MRYFHGLLTKGRADTGFWKGVGGGGGGGVRATVKLFFRVICNLVASYIQVGKTFPSGDSICDRLKRKKPAFPKE